MKGWWKRNSVFFTVLLPLLITAGLVGAAITLTLGPRRVAYDFYVVCPEHPHQWCKQASIEVR